MLAAIRTPNAYIGPIVAGILLVETVGIHGPFPIRRPTRTEIEMVGLGGYANPFFPLKVARPNLISLRARQMESHTSSVGTKTETVGKSFAGSSEVARITPIEPHANDLADFVFHDLHENAFTAQQQSRCLKGSETLLDAHLRQRSGFQIMFPDVGRSLGVILLERSPRPVATRLHAQKDDSSSVRKDRTWLPGGLAGNLKIK